MTFTNGYRIVRCTAWGHTRARYIVKRGESLVQSTGVLTEALAAVPDHDGGQP